MKIPYGEFSYTSYGVNTEYKRDAHLAGSFPRVLQAMELRVYPGGGEEFGVPSGLGDTARVQHDDAVGPLDSGEPMCDHERCAALHERLERLLDVALGFAVESGGGLVENQHRRVLEEGARDSEPLPLPARKAHAVLADHGAEPFRHFADELHCVRRFGGLNDVSLTRSREAPVGDVRGDRVVEQHDILAHQRDVRAQAAELERRDVDAVEQDLSGIRSVEARQQVGERGLARAEGPDQGNDLARFDRKRNPIQSRACAARIAEPDGSEFDFALRAADLARSGIGLGPLVDQAKYALCR